MAKFRNTVNRTQILFEWFLEEVAIQNNLFRERARLLGENCEENDPLVLNSSKYKDCSEMKKFCIENIDRFYLSRAQLEQLDSLLPKQKDDTNYMM